MTAEDAAIASEFESEGHVTRYGSSPDGGGGLVLLLALVVLVWVIVP